MTTERSATRRRVLELGDTLWLSHNQWLPMSDSHRRFTLYIESGQRQAGISKLLGAQPGFSPPPANTIGPGAHREVWKPPFLNLEPLLRPSEASVWVVVIDCVRRDHFPTSYGFTVSYSNMKMIYFIIFCNIHTHFSYCWFLVLHRCRRVFVCWSGWCRIT